ncbi:MAG: AI-2E family transporter [Solirubrobacterales bacterium]
MSNAPSSPSGAPAPEGNREPIQVTVSSVTVVKALLLALLVFLAVVAAPALLGIMLALVFALGLDPVVSKLASKGLSRGLSASIVIFGLILLLGAILIWAVAPIWDEIRGLTGDLPAYIADLEDSPGFKELANNTDVVDKAKELAADAAQKIPESAASLLGLTSGLVGSLLSIVTLLFLTLFLAVGLPNIKKGSLAMLPPAQAAHVGGVIDQVTKVISSSLIGNVAISLIAGTVVGVTAVLIGAPFPVALAVIVGLFDLVPQIGSTIAAFIVCLITLAGAGLAAALILAVVIIVYQQVENYLVQPAVYSTAVDLSGFATIASVLVGGALLGVVGAILAVPVAASLKVIMAEITKPRRERMAAMRGAS